MLIKYPHESHPTERRKKNKKHTQTLHGRQYHFLICALGLRGDLQSFS
jgi:hypothetical protein